MQADRPKPPPLRLLERTPRTRTLARPAPVPQTWWARWLAWPAPPQR